MDRPDASVRAVLYVAAAVCGIAAVGVVCPRPWLERWMELQYALDLPKEPIHEYALRVACATYTVVGLFFLVIAQKPSRHAQFVNLGATGLIFTGLVAFIAGVALDLPPWGYIVNAVLLWAVGLLLVAFSPRWSRGSRRRSSRRRSRSQRPGGGRQPSAGEQPGGAERRSGTRRRKRRSASKRRKRRDTGPRDADGLSDR